MDIKKKRELFLDYAMQIKELGYKVIVKSREDCCYGWIVNDKDEIGYFQLSSWGFGIQFSMIHVPCTGYGSGFSCEKDQFDYQTEMTREIVDRCFAFAPIWASGAKIKKWSAKKFLAQHWDKENDVEL